MARFLLLCLTFFSIISLPAQTRLNVEGDARIMGKLELFRSPSDSSVVIGFQAGHDDNTNANVFIGSEAGSQNNTGRHNTFMGHQAGAMNLNNQNTYLGHRAGSNDQYGYDNTFVGAWTGIPNIGDENVFLGTYAGNINTLGRRNTFLGTRAGVNNTTGNYNTFLGNRSGLLNEAGYSNLFAGCYSGTYNVSGYDNTFLGFSAGSQNTTGHSNTYLGRQAGQTISVDSFNTFVGIRAGYSLFTGSRNTFFGAESGPPGVVDLQGSLALGFNAKVACSNCAVIGGTGTDAVQVGIGTSNPRGALHLLTEGAPPTGLPTEENGLLLGVESTSGYKWIQSYGGDLVINSEGNNVGISTALPSYGLEVNNTAAKPGGGDWTNSASDRRLKKNIRPYEDGLEQLLRIRPVWYQYNGKAGLPTDQTYVGILAQEIREVAPYTVGTFKRDNTEYLNFDGSALRYMLINAVKELNRDLQSKTERIDQLERENQQLTDRLDRLEATLERLMAQSPASGTDHSQIIQLSAEARLDQNTPNPFRQNTHIPFFIPERVKSARLEIHNVEGKKLKSLILEQRGEGQILIKTTDLPDSVLFYSLLLDGKRLATKQMILAR